MWERIVGRIIDILLDVIFFVGSGYLLYEVLNPRGFTVKEVFLIVTSAVLAVRCAVREWKL